MKLLLYIIYSISILFSHEQNSIHKHGMTVSWAFVEDDEIQFTLTAPCQGWVAIGLNTENSLIGSNLIMAAVSDTKLLLSDQYIVDFGKHLPLTDLGVAAQVRMISGNKTKNNTSVTFSIKKSSSDSYHKSLIAGQSYFLTMAFSNEDDFSHHSAMRTTLKIIL